jgi:hypothetical protein
MRLLRVAHRSGARRCFRRAGILVIALVFAIFKGDVRLTQG